MAFLRFLFDLVNGAILGEKGAVDSWAYTLFSGVEFIFLAVFLDWGAPIL